ncbi:hypothetical protein DRQ50_03220 [bacterium]|nr:MAG: hypothetical protein DRQ50_03220 [bacterium]
MLLETITALAQAGRTALAAVPPGGACEVSVSQLDQGQLSFPSLAVLRISGHPLKFIHVGADGDLREHLLSIADVDGRLAGAQVLAEDVLEQVTESLSARYARGRVDHLALAPVSLGTCGVRTFGVRCRSEQGQLFLLADIPSLAETERERGTKALHRLADSCLPALWRNQTELPAAAAAGLVDYLYRSEADVHLFLPVADGRKAEKAAILMDVVDDPAGTRLEFAVPVDAAMRGRLAAGDTLQGRVGLDDRSIEFSLACRGLGVHTLASGLQLVGVSSSLPADIHIVQSRRSFRIPITEDVDVEIESVDPGVGTLTGQLVDLSFNGARLVYTRPDHDVALAVGESIRCRMYLPDPCGPVEITGVIRRTGRSLDDAARPCLEIGIEFSGPGARIASENIRQFVLNRQRNQLAKRVQVAQVGDW